MFQTDFLSIDVQALLTLGFLIFLIVFMFFCYFRFPKFILTITIYLFSLIFMISSLEIELPLSPFIQIFFMLVQSIILLISGIETFEGKDNE